MIVQMAKWFGPGNELNGETAKRVETVKPFKPIKLPHLQYLLSLPPCLILPQTQNINSNENTKQIIIRTIHPGISYWYRMQKK